MTDAHAGGPTGASQAQPASGGSQAPRTSGVSLAPHTAGVSSATRATPTVPPVARVVVVLPVHNEEALLPGCLRALVRAGREARRVRPTVEVDIIVALDGCTDRSAEIATGFPVTCIAAPHRGAAETRLMAVDTGLTAFGSAAVPLDRLWIASTDADSMVPDCWISDFLRLADLGVDLVVGAVEAVGPCDRSHLEAWRARHRPPWGGRPVHGANIGIRASTYVSVGGFAPLPLGEDIDLVTRVRRTPARSIATEGAPVRTCAPTPIRLQRRLGRSAVAHPH